MDIHIRGENGGEAVIDTFGAELKSFLSGGWEYIWNRDPAFWGNSSPFLFPIASNVRNDVVYAGQKACHLRQHGFAKNFHWSVEEQTGDSVTLSFHQNEETLAQYPFCFQLSACYTVREDGVHLHFQVRNNGQEPMPYCLGTHPGFKVPFENSPDSKFEDYSIRFEKPEENSCPIFDGKARQIDVNNRESFLSDPQTLPLDYKIFDRIDTIIFDRLNSTFVELVDNRSGHKLKLSYEPFAYLAFWTPHAPFLCIEPWQGLSVCSDEDDRFESKRGVRIISSGESESYHLDISVS